MDEIQWVKPLLPGDIPANKYPVWNAQIQEWEFHDVVFEPAPFVTNPTPAE